MSNISELPVHERPIVEQFRIVALQYVDADSAAELLSELKTTTLEKLKTDYISKHGDMADNKAERLVKSGADWTEYIEKMVAARAKAHKLKLQLEYLRMLERQQDRMDWAQRTERRMGRSAT